MKPILDETIEDGFSTYKYGSLLGWILVIMAGSIWYLIFEAKYLEYDLNFGNLIVGFILSICTTIGLSIIWFKFENLIKQNIISVILFLLTCSPITLAIVILNYQRIFGVDLSVN